jgi:hypothetical protein
MPKDSYPQVFTCKYPAQYVIETKAGWYDKHGNKDIKLSI